jgi:hypothetical protein
MHLAFEKHLWDAIDRCWHVVVVQLDGHHSFLAHIEALVALIEQIHAGAAAFHMLFVGGSLFEMLAKDEPSHWHAAIKRLSTVCGWKSDPDHLWRKVCSRLFSVCPLVCIVDVENVLQSRSTISGGSERSAFQAVDVDQVDMIFGMHEECDEGNGCLLGKILPLQVKI